MSHTSYEAIQENLWRANEIRAVHDCVAGMVAHISGKRLPRTGRLFAGDASFSSSVEEISRLFGVNKYIEVPSVVDDLLENMGLGKYVTRGIVPEGHLIIARVAVYLSKQDIGDECLMTGCRVPAIWVKKTSGDVSTNVDHGSRECGEVWNNHRLEGAGFDLFGIRPTERQEEMYLLFAGNKRLPFADRLARLSRLYRNNFDQWPDMVVEEIKITAARSIDSVLAKAIRQVREYLLILAMHLYKADIQGKFDWTAAYPTKINWSEFRGYLEQHSSLVEKITGRVLIASVDGVCANDVIIGRDELSQSNLFSGRRTRT